MTVPCRIQLGLCGDIRDGHTFFLQVEERSGSLAWMGGQDVDQPWLRAACDCGWKATTKQRTTLEENSYWRWCLHVEDIQKKMIKGI